VNATLDLLVDGETGVWPLSHGVHLSWFEFARRIAAAAGLPADAIEPRSSRSAATRIVNNRRGWILPSFESALERFVSQANSRY
jgi:dTDP-4-dehydrorhamnose reductase